MSFDGGIFGVDEDVLFESKMLKDMIEKMGIEDPIPLQYISSKILAEVIKYCKYHVENQKTSENKSATPNDEIMA